VITYLNIILIVIEALYASAPAKDRFHPLVHLRPSPPLPSLEPSLGFPLPACAAPTTPTLRFRQAERNENWL
jgi:hypothetical protein